MEIVISILLLATLLFVIGVSEPIADRLGLPHSVVLALLGISLSIAGAVFLGSDLSEVILPSGDLSVDAPIDSQVFLYVFLPTLLFQVTLGVDLRRMVDDWVPILVLAVVAVVVSTLIVGFALSWVSVLPLAVCLLIGSIISTTDPSAVVSIFRSISAPQRLSNIIEGESLLNDAAAIALFGLFMGMVVLEGSGTSVFEALSVFPQLIFGGVATGWFIARVIVYLMTLFPNHEHAQITLSVTLPYFAYVVAEQLIGASGVIAVVAAGLTLNVLGSRRVEPVAWSSLKEVWEILAYWAGALIFILAALFIPRFLEGVQPVDIFLVGVVVLAAFFARVLTLFGLLPMLSWVGLSPSVEPGFRSTILWGGLRGAVTLVLALAVIESPVVSPEIKHSVGILATGFTLFTLLVQGTTLRWVVQALHLDKLNAMDAALARQVVAVSLQTVREEVSEVTSRYGLSQGIVRSEAKDFGRRLDEAVSEAEDCSVLQERDRVTLGLIALAANEKEVTLELIQEGTISSRVAGKMLLDSTRLMEASRSDGRTGYGRASRNSLAYGVNFKLVTSLRRYLGIHAPAASFVASRFEQLLALRLILQELSEFVDARVRRIHGKRVTEILRALLQRRVDHVEGALEGLRLQYPGYAEELERRMIRKVALRYELREIDSLRIEGLIGSELHAVLREDIAQRRIDSAVRPSLDVAVSKNELMRQIPAFEELEASDLRALGKALRTRHLNDGEMVFRQESAAKSVYFIASGAIELATSHDPIKLGRGEVFGQIRAFTNRTAYSSAKAITPTTLLVLEGRAFEEILKKKEKLRERLRPQLSDEFFNGSLAGEL